MEHKKVKINSKMTGLLLGVTYLVNFDWPLRKRVLDQHLVVVGVGILVGVGNDDQYPNEHGIRGDLSQKLPDLDLSHAFVSCLGQFLLVHPLERVLLQHLGTRRELFFFGLSNKKKALLCNKELRNSIFS
jgi:hypothetical protein